MNAIEYLKEQKRMCTSYEDCAICPFCSDNYWQFFACNDFQTEHPEKAVEILEKWSKEHPVKTIKDDFFEKYPNAKLREEGIPESCAKNLGYKTDCRYGYCVECWNTPLK